MSQAIEDNEFQTIKADVEVLVQVPRLRAAAQPNRLALIFT